MNKIKRQRVAVLELGLNLANDLEVALAALKAIQDYRPLTDTIDTNHLQVFAKNAYQEIDKAATENE